jgi:hypothetical protein
VEAVELLREAANSGTPKDLAGWRLSIPLLHELLTEYNTKNGAEAAMVSLEDLQTWCNRSYQACQQLAWLNLFRTDTTAQY